MNQTTLLNTLTSTIQNLVQDSIQGTATLSVKAVGLSRDYSIVGLDGGKVGNTRWFVRAILDRDKTTGKVLFTDYGDGKSRASRSNEIADFSNLTAVANDIANFLLLGNQ
jgi:hypothetical protein